jgi:hypothetical protein
MLLNRRIDETDGATFQDPITTEEISRIMDGFVDDMSLWATIQQPQTVDNQQTEAQSIEALVTKLKDAAQWWEQLLHASGGKLELEKCFFYILHWQFDEEGQPSLAPKDKIPHQIQLTSSETNLPIEIKQKDCKESHKTLGSMENPSRIFNDELTRITNKIATYAGKFTQVKASQHDVYTLQDSFYIPSVGYTLPTTQFSMNELSRAQQPAVAALLQALGYNQSTNRSVAFGPEQDGRIGLRHLYVEQGTAQSLLLIGHI